MKTPPPASRPALNEQGLPRDYAFRSEYELTPRQLRAARQDPSARLVLIDVRRPDEYQAARIEGAVLIPLAEVERRADEIADLAEEAGEGAIVAVHCHHGVRSLKATLALRAKGINAWSIAGGIDLWSLDIDPSVPRY